MTLRHVRSEADLPTAPVRLGPGWRAVVEELNRRLWRLRPSAAARATIGMDGLLGLVVYDPARREEVDTLCTETLTRAAGLCELCGRPGNVRSGVVLTVCCARCDVASAVGRKAG